LASRQFYSVDLVAFTLSSGQVLTYCSGDRDITWNSTVWSAGGTVGPYVIRQGKAAKCRWKTGVEVDSLTFDIIPGYSTVAGLPFLVAINQGIFDGAEVTLYRAFMPSYGNMAEGAVIIFVGRVAELEIGNSITQFTINSHLELLNQKLPRNLYQAGCINTLYDTACAVDAEALAVTATVATGSFTHRILASLSAESGYFDLGKVVFITGNNSGISRTVKTYMRGIPSSVDFTAPFPSIPATGDSFKIYPGCDKQQNTCASKFTNLANFRGFPYIPENSTAV
jgi:uncharacterized phage protein (TIGR02218 family)